MADRDEVRTQVRFPRDLHERIAAEAQAQERSFNGQVIWLLRQALAEQAFRAMRDTGI